jgi:hypothetical protein
MLLSHLASCTRMYTIVNCNTSKETVSQSCWRGCCFEAAAAACWGTVGIRPYELYICTTSCFGAAEPSAPDQGFEIEPDVVYYSCSTK